MDSDDNNYVPRSPDLTAHFDPSYDPEPLHPQHQSYRGSVSHVSPFTPTGATDSYFGRGQPGPVDYRGGASTSFSAYPQPVVGGMVKGEDDDEEYGAGKKSRGRGRGKRSYKQEDDDMMGPEGAGSGSGSGIEVRTKFPVARIKRIMQADEDVGKVAQVTPVVVAKALELFMISLVSKAAVEAKSRSSKRVLASDLKQAVLKDEQFDFLNDIVGKVADAPTASKGGASGGGDGDSDDGEVKKKRGGRKKKKEADDF